MTTLLVLTLACTASPADRVWPIATDLGGESWSDSYTYTQGGTRVEAGGGLPVVEYAERRALQLRITHDNGLWHVGIARGGWGRFQLDDFGPDGVLEFDIAGSLRGPAFAIIADCDADGPGPDTDTNARVPLGDYVTPSDDWQHVSVPLKDFLAVAPELSLLHMTKVVFEGTAPSGESTLYLADVRFRTDAPERTYAPIKVDQVGYHPAWPKRAKVIVPAPLGGRKSFRLLRADTETPVFEGELSVAPVQDEPSGDMAHDADFSACAEVGEFTLDVPGIGRSVPFRIGLDVYGRLLVDAVRFFHYQRCGMELTTEHAGPYAHRACHVFDEAIPDPRGGTRDCRGGWHDAGDMNRYVPSTIEPTFMLLSLRRHCPGLFPDGSLGVPESGNGLPDLLDEVRFELEWVRKMLIREGPDAGLVYDRVHESGAQQPEGVDFFDRRHRLSDPTAEAACALVADLAHAYLAFRDFPAEQDFADACLGDAGNPPLGSHFSAAALLFEATGDAGVHAVAKRLAPQVLADWHGRINYGSVDAGLATYCLSERPQVDAELQARLREYYVGYANAVVEAAQASGYDTPMVPGVVFSWGSNGHCIARSGAHLLMVDRFAPRPEYEQVARDALHWLLGRSAVDQCMVTGYGSPALGPIYHSMFGPLGPGLPTPPGYLPGGVTVSDCPGLSQYPAKAWRATHTCWELTEPCITYQGPFVYLLGALMAGD